MKLVSTEVVKAYKQSHVAHGHRGPDSNQLCQQEYLCLHLQVSLIKYKQAVLLHFMLALINGSVQPDRAVLLGSIAFLLLLRADGRMGLVALFSGLGHTTAMGPYLCQTVNVRWLGHLYLGAPFKQATLWLLLWTQKKRDTQ